MITETVDIANPKSKQEFIEYYKRVRNDTEALTRPLAIEDYMIQAMTEASPTKWHIAHVSWFFEAFILRKFSENYKPLNELYNYLFNSYYQDVGKQWPRPDRSNISRPTVAEVFEFRKFIDGHMLSLIDRSITNESINTLTVLGGNHEQQHQELMMTDIKYNLSVNPLFPAYTKNTTPHKIKTSDIPELKFVPFESGLVEIGNRNEQCFAFDNEMPIKKEYLGKYNLANRLITNGEYLKFIEAGGYTDFKYWLSEGWDRVRNEKWEKPLYWHNINGEWYIYTLSGLKPLDLNEPVTHVSYFEADAFAKWSGKRLPTETEIENVMNILKIDPASGNFRESNLLQPRAVTHDDIEAQKVAQLYGDVWEWTASAYLPYPGFNVLAEGVSEYNGKFMSSQFVLKGGSCVTPIDHIRPSYRNFWHPHTRFQFTGIRLAE